MAATLRLVGGAKWVPELLDHNTLEWQQLANEVETQVMEMFGNKFFIFFAFIFNFFVFLQYSLLIEDLLIFSARSRL